MHCSVYEYGLSCAGIWPLYPYSVYEYGSSLSYRAQSMLLCIRIWPQYTYSVYECTIVCMNITHVCAIMRNLRYRA
jgi:hypothetical protein